jgi:hypothetical protein
MPRLPFGLLLCIWLAMGQAVAAQPVTTSSANSGAQPKDSSEGPSLDDLVDALKDPATRDRARRIQYRVRGSTADYPGFDRNVTKNVGLWLEAQGAAGFQDLASKVGLAFQNKPLPF